MHKFKALYIIVLIFSLFMMGCSIKQTPSTNQKQEASEQVKKIEKLPVNSQGHTSEQQNILDRIKVTSDFSKVMWMHFINFDGKIYRRTPVRNKITSSGKRLEPVTAMGFSWGQYGEHSQMPRYKDFFTSELLQPDGTFGGSNDYNFWFDPMGRYHQYSPGQLLTDYPIDVDNPIDEITGLYRMQNEAYKWQQNMEAQLKGQQ